MDLTDEITSFFFAIGYEKLRFFLIVVLELEILGVAGDSALVIVCFSVFDKSGIPSDAGSLELLEPFVVAKSFTVTGLGGSARALLDLLGVPPTIFWPTTPLVTAVFFVVTRGAFSVLILMLEGAIDALSVAILITDAFSVLMLMWLLAGLSAFSATITTDAFSVLILPGLSVTCLKAFPAVSVSVGTLLTGAFSVTALNTVLPGLNMGFSSIPSVMTLQPGLCALTTFALLAAFNTVDMRFNVN
jgi:hypothetical protein